MATSQAATLAVAPDSYYRAQWNAFRRYRVRGLKIREGDAAVRFSTAVLEDGGETVIKIILFLAVVPILAFSFWVMVRANVGEPKTPELWKPFTVFVVLIVGFIVGLVYFAMRRQTVTVKAGEITYHARNFLIFSKSGTIPLAEITSIGASSKEIVVYHGPHQIPVLTADLGANSETIRDGIVAAIGLLNPHCRLR